MNGQRRRRDAKLAPGVSPGKKIEKGERRRRGTSLPAVGLLQIAGNISVEFGVAAMDGAAQGGFNALAFAQPF